MALPPSTMAAIELDKINVYYGDSHVIQDLSLRVDRGDAVSILGRNGVGKTTTLRAIMGLTPPRSGKVAVLNTDVSGWQPHQIARKRVAYVPAERHIFPGLSVQENLQLARRSDEQAHGWDIAQIYALFPVLGVRRHQDGSTLSGGEQQMLAIGRALMGNPEIMLLDEPSQGLAPVFVNAFAEIVKGLCERHGLTLLLVEQNFNLAFKLAGRHFLMESKGRIRGVATTEELLGKNGILEEHLAL